MLGPEAVAGRAGAERVVEGEQPGLDLVDRETGDGTGELGGEDRPFAVVGILRHRDPLGQRERGLQRIGDPVAGIGPDHQPVHDHLDVVLEVLVERRHGVDVVQRPVHLDPGEALLLELAELLAVLALASAHDGREQVDPRAFVHRLHAVDHLGDRLALDRKAGRGRIGDADAREQEPHVVVDFRHRAHRRARVAGRRLLFDGDRRRQPVDRIDVGLLHQLKELAGIGRQALDIAPLPLGVDRVEGEGGFSRAGQPGQNDERVARNLHVDVLEIVFPGAANDDLGLHAASDYFHRPSRAGIQSPRPACNGPCLLTCALRGGEGNETLRDHRRLSGLRARHGGLERARARCRGRGVPRPSLRRGCARPAPRRVRDRLRDARTDAVSAIHVREAAPAGAPADQRDAQPLHRWRGGAGLRGDGVRHPRGGHAHGGARLGADPRAGALDPGRGPDDPRREAGRRRWASVWRAGRSA